MQATLMQHKDHGLMHVYNPTEKMYVEKYGWREARQEPKEPKKVEEEKATPFESLTTVDLKAAYTKKFGKAPHWNMNRKSIEKKLNGDSE
jgi:hypothetical protein